MKIDFTEVINNKLQEMAENRVIEKQIEETLEKSITTAINNALGSFDFKNKLEKVINGQIGNVAESIGLSGYNQFIAETFNDIINNVIKKDIKQKIAGAVENIYLKKLENIKLSEIVKRYRETLLDSLDDDEKYSHDNRFNVSIEERGDEIFKNVTVCLGIEKHYFSNDEYCLRVNLMSYKDKDYSITSVTYGGNDLRKL